MKTLRLVITILAASCASLSSVSFAQYAGSIVLDNASAANLCSGQLNNIESIINSQIRVTGSMSISLGDSLGGGTLPVGMGVVVSLPQTAGVITGGAKLVNIGSGTLHLVPDIVPTILIPMPRASCLFENQIFEMYATVLGYSSADGSTPPQMTSCQWQVAENGGVWRDVGSKPGDAQLFVSSTQNPLVLGPIQTNMNGWKFRVKADVEYGNNRSASGVLSQTATLTVKPSFVVSPSALAMDASNNLYVADPLANAIWKITGDNKVSIFAGSATKASGLLNATGTLARFNKPGGIAWFGGKLYVADTDNNAIRVIDSNGAVTTLAGDSAGVRGYKEGTGTGAYFDGPKAITVDSSGNIYVVDAGNNVVRKITPGGVTSRIAGECFDWGGSITVISGGFASGGSFSTGVWSMSGATTFGNSGTLSLISIGAGSQLMDGVLGIGTILTATSVPIDVFGNYSGTVLLTNGNRLVLNGNIYQDSGLSLGTTGTLSSLSSLQAQFSEPQVYDAAETAPYYFNSSYGIAVSPDKKYLYIADTGNNAICRVTIADGTVAPLDVTIQTTATGAGVSGTTLAYPCGLRFDAGGNLLIADMGNSRIVKVSPATGQGTVVAGSPYGYGYDDGSGEEAMFNFPMDVVVANNGALYVADTDNAVIRSVSGVSSGSQVSVTTRELLEAPANASPSTGNADSGGGGGGGAPSAWYLLALGALAALRLWRR